ncbi:hypothetical protein SPI_05819 [Niveomyces insectorum RCEF 264]|uniref:Uncharacterized protein n=1 Tax=Niveomyces insectorum RCEF 264 TaxID=1081102 RepID=A0A167SH27_9HYPO|nr:hypothetical protein SPI_05819 [Niveomyces insectorum RCEF 264]
MDSNQGFGVFRVSDRFQLGHSGGGGRQIAEQLMLPGFTVFGAGFLPASEDTRVFVLLATALNLGLELLETLGGRQMLRELGLACINGWAATGAQNFAGDVLRMSDYVEHFLQRMRAFTPMVTLGSDMKNRDTIAGIGKFEAATFQLDNFVPNLYMHYAVNLEIVRAMELNDRQLWRPFRAGEETQQQYEADRKNLKSRHNTLLFILGIAFYHETCHMFTAYLAGNGVTDSPLNVTYLEYGEDQKNESSGESGRWAEAHLLGGSLEVYRDTNEGDDTSHGAARRIKESTIQSFVENVRTCPMPLKTFDRAVTPETRIRIGLRSFAHTNTGTHHQAGQAMSAL